MRGLGKPMLHAPRGDDRCQLHWPRPINLKLSSQTHCCCQHLPQGLFSCCTDLLLLSLSSGSTALALAMKRERALLLAACLLAITFQPAVAGRPLLQCAPVCCCLGQPGAAAACYALGSTVPGGCSAHGSIVLYSLGDLRGAYLAAVSAMQYLLSTARHLPVVPAQGARSCAVQRCMCMRCVCTQLPCCMAAHWAPADIGLPG